MRAVPALLVWCLLLSGCGDTLWGELLPQPSIEFEAEPSGSTLRLIRRGRASAAALVQETGDRRLWRTAGNQVVETDGGRIVATAGFPEMLAATRFDGPDPLAEPAALLTHSAAARRMVDLMRSSRKPEGMRFGIQVECRLRAEPTEDAAVLLVTERCRAEGAGRFTNLFWVSAESGAVRQATQWVGPEAPMLTVEFPLPRLADGAPAGSSAGP